MGMVKVSTTWIPTQTMYRLENAHPAWEMHPDLVQAVKSLDSYNLWICEVVMPIVFQWIEENHDAVYKDIPPGHHDDVGVVIAKAFSLVQERSYYKKGLDLSKQYEQQVKNRQFNHNAVNPDWQRMSAALDKAKEAVKEDFRKLLGTTVKSG